LASSECCISIFSKPHIDINSAWISYCKRMSFCLNFINIIEFDGNFVALVCNKRFDIERVPGYFLVYLRQRLQLLP
jgi:hypothetical protein